MKNLIYLTVLYTGSTLFATVHLGSHVLNGAKHTERTVAIGDNALSRAENITDSIVIGDAVGLMMKSNNNVIAIGKGALSGTEHVDGTVAIGQYEMFGESYNRDTTSINGKQLWISKPLEAFCINPNKERDITKTPFYYINGELHINAPIVYEGAFIGGVGDAQYDMYLSENGDDANHGHSPYKAKKTIGGVYATATDGMRIGVLPGSYLPPSNDDPAGDVPYLIATTNRLEFVAIEGKEKTSIVGVYENEDGFNDGFHHTLAFESGPQTFRGFTIKNLGGWKKNINSGTSKTIAPIASCVAFIDCAIENDILRCFFTFSGFNSCSFENTSITANKWCYTGISSNADALFAGCGMYNCKVSITDVENIPRSDGMIGIYRFFHAGEFRSTLFLLPPFKDEKEFDAKAKPIFEDCTIIYDVTLDNRTHKRFFGAATTNCYFAIGDNEALSISTQNVYATSWTNTLLNAEYVATSIDCPAVRDDGRKDAGWKDSGLGWQKSFSSRANIKLEDGVLVVYQGGVKIGSIAMEPSATTLNAPRPTTTATTPEEHEDESEASPIILMPLK